VLLRDATYGQLLRRARAEKHRRAAGWIDALGRPDDHAELLAHHFVQALELSRATGAEDDPGLARRASPVGAGRRRTSFVAFGLRIGCGILRFGTRALAAR
jgi:hypothetical protein